MQYTLYFWSYETRADVLRVGWFLLFLDLTIGKAQATIHVGSVWNPPEFAQLPWPRLWPKCARKRVDAVDKSLWNSVFFIDGTDVLYSKSPEITNRPQLAVMRSAVRSRLSPPEKSWNLMISGLFLYFLPQIIGRIFAVMRPDPDLTQTGAKTQWIYWDLFDKTARIYYFSIVFRIF